MFPTEFDIKLHVFEDGRVGIEGPDLVQGRAIWDYVLNELRREIDKRTAKMQDQLVRPATPGEVVGAIGGDRGNDRH